MNELDILLDDYGDVKEWLMGVWTDRVTTKQLALALKREDIREWARGWGLRPEELGLMRRACKLAGLKVGIEECGNDSGMSFRIACLEPLEEHHE